MPFAGMFFVKYIKKMHTLLRYLSPGTFRADTLSGLTVALALVPEAIAFAFVAQVDPIVGLYAAFMVSLITGVLSGRPGMISGATGALAVVMVGLVVAHGVDYLFATVVLMGIIQLLVGLFRFGKFSRIIPYPVMLGFVNGLAIVILLSQLPHFQSFTPEGHFGWLYGTWITGEKLWIMLGLVVMTMLVIWLLPKLTKAIPSSLVAIGATSLLVYLLDLDTPTVRDMLGGGSLAASLPQFQLPMVPLNLETLSIILPYALVLAFIGLVESLMTLTLIDEITDTRGKSDRECLAQGSANVVTGMFGGMGGCAMVGQSMINISSGGRGRWSGIVAGLTLLSFILFAAQWIEQIPLAALVGVMFMVVIGTFAWASIRLMGKIPHQDYAVIATVSAATVLYDLAVAVIVGIIMSSLFFVWRKSQKIYATSWLDKDGGKHYTLSGYVFFGSVQNFSELFVVSEDPDQVYIDFMEARVLDHSGIEALNRLTDKYLKAGKELHLYHLSSDCRKLLKNADKVVEVNIKEDPHYEVADDKLDS